MGSISTSQVQDNRADIAEGAAYIGQGATVDASTTINSQLDANTAGLFDKFLGTISNISAKQVDAVSQIPAAAPIVIASPAGYSQPAITDNLNAKILVIGGIVIAVIVVFVLVKK